MPRKMTSKNNSKQCSCPKTKAEARDFINAKGGRDKLIFMLCGAIRQEDFDAIPNDGCVYPFILRDTVVDGRPADVYLTNSYGETWSFLNGDYKTRQMGKWVGVYNPVDKTFDTTVPEPTFADDE